MKKILSVLILVILSFSLVACSSGGSKENSAATKKIVIWNAGIQSNDDSGKIKKEDLPLFKAIKKFEKENSGYKVTVVDYSMDDLQKAFTAANLSKKGPDIVAIWAGSATQAYTDYLVDFEKYLKDDELKTFDTSSLVHANSNSNDALIGLPTGASSTPVMYYNKEIFDKNNLEVPTTFDELEKVSKELKKNKVTPMILGDKDGYESTWAVSSLLANELGPDNIANLGNGKEKLSGDNFRTAIAKWKEYINKGYTNPDYLTMSDGDGIQSFVQGNGAMIIHGNWAARDFAQMGEKVEVANIPAISKDAPFADNIVSQPNINLVVTNYSKVTDKAVELAKVLASPEFNKESNAAFYSDKTASRLMDTIDSYTGEGKNVTGFDSIITGDAAAEFYKLVPTYNKGSLKEDDFVNKLDGLNVKK